MAMSLGGSPRPLGDREIGTQLEGRIADLDQFGPWNSHGKR